MVKPASPGVKWYVRWYLGADVIGGDITSLAAGAFHHFRDLSVASLMQAKQAGVKAD